MNFKHGHAIGSKRSKELNTWQDMIKRCTNKNRAFYERYGGRGIYVCNEWLDFKNFLRDMGQCPEGYTLERINNDGPYSKENCKWATKKEQARNRCSNRIIEANGERKTLAEWCEIANLPYARVKARIDKLGWSAESALELVIDE